MNFKSSTLTHLRNLLFEEPCPKCGVLIQKNGGCPHMVCGKCRHEFCWFCLGPYFSYRHTKGLACPFREVAVYGMLVLMFFGFNFKLSYLNEYMFNIEWFLFYNLSAFLLIHVYFLSFVIHGIFIDIHKEYIRTREVKKKKLLYKFQCGGFLTILMV